MRFIFFIFFSFFFINGFSSITNNQKERANQLYSKGLYKESGIIYDSLLGEGNYSKNILYRMAYISERFNQYGKAIFFLRKIASEFGDQEARERIQVLMDKSGVEGVMTDDGLELYDYLNRNTALLSFALILVTILGGLYYWKYPSTKSLRGLLGLLIVDAVVVTGLIYTNYLIPARCVIITTTTFYESPSYANQAKIEAPMPGSVMIIEDKNDIWYQVALNDKSYWIPFFTIREL